MFDSNQYDPTQYAYSQSQSLGQQYAYGQRSAGSLIWLGLQILGAFIIIRAFARRYQRSGAQGRHRFWAWLAASVLAAYLLWVPGLNDHWPSGLLWCLIIASFGSLVISVRSLRPGRTAR